jgi:hypothetical protein
MLTLTSPVETWAHRLPAGLKLAALAVATTGLFLTGSPWLWALPLRRRRDFISPAGRSLRGSGDVSFGRFGPSW